MLRFPHKYDVRFVFTFSCLFEGLCLIYVILFVSGVQLKLCCVFCRLVASFSELSIFDCPFGILYSLFALEAFSFDITHVYIFLTFDFIGINIHSTFSVCSVCICTCSRFDRTSSVCSVYLFSVKNI
jgi:hypothetical protein